MSKMGEEMEMYTHKAAERDQDVDDWFNEHFESMKEGGSVLLVPIDVEEETPMSEEGVVLKDSDEVNEDDPLADMMESFEEML